MAEDMVAIVDVDDLLTLYCHQKGNVAALENIIVLHEENEVAHKQVREGLCDIVLLLAKITLIQTERLLAVGEISLRQATEIVEITEECSTAIKEMQGEIDDEEDGN